MLAQQGLVIPLQTWLSASQLCRGADLMKSTDPAAWLDLPQPLFALAQHGSLVLQAGSKIRHKSASLIPIERCPLLILEAGGGCCSITNAVVFDLLMLITTQHPAYPL